ncbi:hypothetical protein PSTEL_22075 [Paenibacillus stellifer]|uniref:Lipoprotein n=1 Tax=Paenibacillus stellifer TaxID=169760 RepID=A0A089N9G8_9BACL|nr:hypothetical protein [Paenibacillus stellifer]AIQ65404.1 hypothetical protein PSTEL_22075 [Paenibacillus stellifer]
MKKICIFLLAAGLALSGCSSDSVDTPRYEGKRLVIGVIGNPPKVREAAYTVKWKEVTFTSLQNSRDKSEIDAVIITEDHLAEADSPEYAKLYQEGGIPFFFIGSKKSYIPFVHEDLAYQDVPDLSADMYATGYYQTGDKGKYWGYGLYNDKLNDANIKDVYSRIFTTIASLNL